MNPVPEKLINFRVYYEDGTDLLGIADVELPKIEAMTETVKGAGIAGEVESPVLGHFGSMTCTINWRTVVKPTIGLAEPRAHNLDFRGAAQLYDAATGEYRTSSLKVSIRGIPKTTSLGKFEVGATADASNEFEVIYLKGSVDGKEIIEIDKYNYICRINGKDYLKGVRQALGL